MHELSIALSIIDLANETLKNKEQSVVSEIELEIGKFAGVDTAALLTALEMASARTPFSSARFRITPVKATAKCRDCGTEFDLENYLSSCPACKSFRTMVITGKELRLKSIIINH